jgi:two-component system, chemotaxis family, protein-glutamate methylesterase/glutaminase
LVIGGSAGGLQALDVLLSKLPVDLPAALLVVVHKGGTP